MNDAPFDHPMLNVKTSLWDVYKPGVEVYEHEYKYRDHVVYHVYTVYDVNSETVVEQSQDSNYTEDGALEYIPQFAKGYAAAKANWW